MSNATLGQKNTTNAAVGTWISEMAKLCQPETVFWCSGSEAEKQALTAEALAKGVLVELNQEKLPITAPIPTTSLELNSAPIFAPTVKRTPAPPTIGRPPKRCTKSSMGSFAARCGAGRCMSFPI